MKQKLKTGMVAMFMVTAFTLSAKNIELKNEAFLEKEETAVDGKKTKKMVPATNVLPGEEVIFIIRYKNIGKEPATEVVVTNPIPQHMTYKSVESAAEGVVAEVSVDGGKAFGDFSKLRVRDDLRKERPALPQDVTHVRWRVMGALAPNQGGEVKLRATLN